MPRVKRTWVTPKGARLLRRAAAKIAKFPDRYDQSDYAYLGECGTTCCVAGWVVNEAGYNPLNMPNIHGRAVRLLTGINCHKLKVEDPALAEAYDRLFSGGPGEDWPEPYSTGWHRAATNKQRACIAKARIEHFIKTGE